MKLITSEKPKLWIYILIFTSLFLVNLLPSITEKPYQPADTQDVIMNLLMVATEPYRAYGFVFHLATLLLIAAILIKPGKLERLVAGYMSLNFFIIAAAQTMGQTQKYGLVVHTAALVTMILLGITWLVVAIRNDLSPAFHKPTIIEIGLILLAVIPFWGPYAVSNGVIQPNFDPRLLLVSPDYGLTFCFTAPVFLLALILFYPGVNLLAFRITAFCGLLYAIFNLAQFFNPDTRWMGFLHLPLLVISLYALILPSLPSGRVHSNPTEP